MKLEGKTNTELLAMQRDIETNPTYMNPTGSFYRFTGVARAKLDKITRQITHNLAMKRAAEGRPIPCDGYSGRQTNRR